MPTYLIFHVLITLFFFLMGAYIIKTQEFSFGFGRPPIFHVYFSGLSAVIIGVTGIMGGLVCLIPFVYCFITQTAYSPNAGIFIGFGIFFPFMGLVMGLFVKLNDYLESLSEQKAKKKKRS